MTLEIDNANHLVSLLLKADKPYYLATKPLLGYSIRTLGNAFEVLEEELMPSIISHKCGNAYEQHKALLKLFLLNLVAVGFAHERLSIGSCPRKGDYATVKFGLDQRKSKRLVDALVNHGFMELLWKGNRHVKVVNN